jgi:hypothetical protein
MLIPNSQSAGTPEQIVAGMLAMVEAGTDASRSAG